MDLVKMTKRNMLTCKNVWFVMKKQKSQTKVHNLKDVKTKLANLENTSMGIWTSRFKPNMVVTLKYIYKTNLSVKM